MGCDGGCDNCNDCQTLCETTGEYGSDYFKCLNDEIGDTARDALIYKAFNRTKLNLLADLVIQTAELGRQKNSRSGLSWTEEEREFVYAEKMNEFVALLSSWGRADSPPGTVVRDDICTSTWWTQLKESVASLKVALDACHQCNASCDGCDGCECDDE